MITLCSRQDFATKMARLDAVILNSYRVLQTRPTNSSLAARYDSLHQAMGYRPDQPEY